MARSDRLAYRSCLRLHVEYYSTTTAVQATARIRARRSASSSFRNSLAILSSPIGLRTTTDRRRRFERARGRPELAGLVLARGFRYELV